MVGSLEGLRNETAALVVAAVGDGWEGFVCSTAWPHNLAPPCAFIAPPLVEDWIKAGPMFGEWTVALDIALMADEDTAQGSLDVIEDLVEAILPALDGYAILAVEAPIPTAVTDGGAEYLASVIRVSKAIRFD